ncbi:MAG: hypothetical protein JJT94_03760, partial [Bernardetiaceae bacterium]|nr:hypothetical protein [Bernardetiaceae bacterium]
MPNNYTKILVLSFFICVMFFESRAQVFEFEASSRHSYRMPFKKISHLIILPVWINNSDSLFFILDTGSSNTIISELSAKDSIDLNYSREVNLGGLGEGENLKAWVTYQNQMRIGRFIQSASQTVLVLQNDIFFLTEKLGFPINGILGAAIFQDFKILIDYKRSEIIFYAKNKKRNTRPPDPKYWHYIPIEIENDKFYFWACLSLAPDIFVPVRLLIDTGGGHNLWIDANSDARISIPTPYLETNLGRGFNGDIKGKITRGLHLHLYDELELKDFLIAFPDSSSLQHVREVESRNGSIGAEFLRRFQVMIDAQAGYMYLRPNNEIHAPFEFDMSGMEVIAPLGKI